MKSKSQQSLSIDCHSDQVWQIKLCIMKGKKSSKKNCMQWVTAVSFMKKMCQELYSEKTPCDSILVNKHHQERMIWEPIHIPWQLSEICFKFVCMLWRYFCLCLHANLTCFAANNQTSTKLLPSSNLMKKKYVNNMSRNQYGFRKIILLHML